MSNLRTELLLMKGTLEEGWSYTKDLTPFMLANGILKVKFRSSYRELL